MLLHPFLVWSGAQFSEQLWKLLFAGHGHQVALLEPWPPCRKPPQETRWTRLRHFLYTPIWAQTETRWLRYILNDSDPNTVSTDQELVPKQFWVAEPDHMSSCIDVSPCVVLRVEAASKVFFIHKCFMLHCDFWLDVFLFSFAESSFQINPKTTRKGEHQRRKRHWA